jgi:hypothetical protein
MSQSLLYTCDRLPSCPIRIFSVVMYPRDLEQLAYDVDKNFRALAKEVTELRQFQSALMYEKQVQAALELMGRMHNNHVSYTNLIVVAGYAGFFTFWSTIKSDLPKWLYALSGLLIIVSLLCFIAWEVTKMIWGGLHLRKSEAQLTSHRPDEGTILRLQREIDAFDRKLNRLWIWFLIPTVSLGFASGLSLVGFFVWRLFLSLK